MTTEEKDNNRLKFKWVSVWLVVGSLVAGVALAVNGTVDGFAGIASGVMVFAGAVFAVDYSTNPEKGVHR